MTYLRHPSRQVLLTVGGRVKAGLIALGWDDLATTPAGAPPITVVVGETLPHQRANQFEAGKVYVTLGDLGSPLDEELGGPLISQEYPLFIDCIMDKSSIAGMLADDVCDLLMGRLAPGKRVFPVLDHAQTPASVTEWTVELEDLERVRPDVDTTLSWIAVKVTAYIAYNEAHDVELS